jgi:hypothetical protein
VRVCASARECVLLGHGIHCLALIYSPPAVSERVDKALAGGGGGKPPVRHVDPAALALLGLLSLRCLCAAEVAARLSPLHSPFD